MLLLTMSQHNNTTMTPSGDNTTMNTTYGLTGLLVFVIVVVIVIAIRRKCRRTPSRTSSVDQEEPPNPVPAEGGLNYEQPVFVSNPSLTREAEKWTGKNWSHLADDIKWLLRGHVIERERIRLGNVIGKGKTVKERWKNLWDLNTQDLYTFIHQTTNLSTHLSTHLSIHSSIHPSIHSSVHPFINPPIHPRIHSSTHPLIYPHIHPLIYPLFPSFIHPSIHSFGHLSIHVRMHAYIIMQLTIKWFGPRLCIQLYNCILNIIEQN